MVALLRVPGNWEAIWESPADRLPWEPMPEGPWLVARTWGAVLPEDGSGGRLDTWDPPRGWVRRLDSDP